MCCADSGIENEGEKKTWNGSWCGSFNNPVLSFPDIFTGNEKTKQKLNGLEAPSETVCMPKDNIPTLDKE